jgi:putative FmdB family regulatory protein
MPFYSYSCSTCKKTFKAFHSPDEIEKKCIICKSESVSKLLPTVRNVSVKEVDNSPKDRVEKFIEESREVLKEQLRESRKELK